MKKFLKWIAILFSIIVLGALIGVALLATFISPNSFKPMIAEQVKKATGRHLKMDGNIAWTIYPTLGLKIGHIALDNPVSFQEPIFAEVDNATIGVSLLPLIHGKVESTGITLSGLKINLIKTASGQTNWQLVPTMGSASHSESKVSKSSATAPLALAIAGLDVTNATINWTDEASNKAFSISDFDLHAQDINFNKPFAITSQFKFVQKNPAISAKVTTSGQVDINIAKQLYQVNNFHVTGNIVKDGKSFDQNTTGNLVIDMAQQTLSINNFSETIATLTMNGKLSVTDLSTTPRARGHVNIPAFDLKKWLQAMGQDVPNIQDASNARGDIDFSAVNGAVNAQGNFAINKLRASNVTIENINMQANFQNNQLNITPITADLYQGKLQAQADVNLTSETPKIAVEGRLINVQAQPLLQDLKGDSKLSVSGAANIDWKVTTVGTDGEAVIKNLNGTSHLTFNNGSVKGIDLGNMIDSAAALLKKQPMPSNSSNQTNFGTLTANATITNGVVKNEDLFLDSPRFDTKGAGTIDLVNQKIDYKLQSTVKKDFQEKVSNTVNLDGLLIPIFITGSLDNPSIRLDTSVLLKAFTKQQMASIEQKVKKRLQNQVPKIQDKLQDQANVQAKEAVDQAKKALQNILGH